MTLYKGPFGLSIILSTSVCACCVCGERKSLLALECINIGTLHDFKLICPAQVSWVSVDVVVMCLKRTIHNIYHVSLHGQNLVDFKIC